MDKFLKFLKFIILSPLIPILGIVEDDESTLDTDSPEEQPENNNNADDEASDSDDSSDDDSGDDSDENFPEETVPKSTFIEMKRKYREEKKKNAAYEDSRLSDEEIQTKNEIMQMLTERDVTEDSAKDIADAVAIAFNKLNAGRKTNQQKVLEEEIAELAQDDLYSDIGQYQNEIVQTLAKAKKADLPMTIEQAYYMVAGNKRKIKEARTRDEVIASAKGSNKDTTKTIPTASSNRKNEAYPLDAYDKKALNELKKAMPDSNWDAKKYYEMIKK